MTTQTSFSAKPCFLLAAWICGFSPLLQAAPTAVLAPVLEVKGSADAVNPSSGKSKNLKTGELLVEGSAIATGSNGRVGLSPLPGIAVSLAKATNISIVRLAVTKNGDTIEKRDVVLKLETGALSFSLDKRNAGKTSFVVLTPYGTLDAQQAVGTVAVVGSTVQVASLSGTTSFTPTGSQTAIAISSGSVMAASGSGASLQISVINAVARTTATFNADGTPLTTREATPQELQSTRAMFEATLGHAALAVSYGMMSAEDSAAVTTALTAVNQSFVAAGLAPVDAPPIGASTPAAGSESEAASAPPGFTGSSANPANTSGPVNSRER